MSELKETTQRPRVRVNLGFTKNLGDFNSLRLDLAVEEDARPGEVWQEATDRLYDELEAKFIEKMRQVERELEG